MDINQLLKPEAVSKLLGVSQQTLAIWRCNKRYALKYVKVGRYVRYRYQDVMDFISDRTIDS
jgi:predicted DNA-binding transcriptional regulator AlpA